MVKKGLGRGFDSLIPLDVIDETFDATAKQDEKVSELRYITLSDIVPNPDQPRRHFDEVALAELAASIVEHGILQPIVVTLRGGEYEIIAGERRWRAAKLAGLNKIPALIRTITDQHKLELALIENLQRKDLNPLETATAYQKLSIQFNMTHAEIARRVGYGGSSTISNILRLLNLPDDAKQALVAGEISEGHARQILALEGDEAAQKTLQNYIIKEGWSVRKSEQFVIGYKKGDNKLESSEKAVRHTQTETPLTQALSKRLKLKVKHKTTAHGGQIIIAYSDDEQLARIQKLIQ